MCRRLWEIEPQGFWDMKSVSKSPYTIMLARFSMSFHLFRIGTFPRAEEDNDVYFDDADV